MCFLQCPWWPRQGSCSPSKNMLDLCLSTSSLPLPSLTLQWWPSWQPYPIPSTALKTRCFEKEICREMMGYPLSLRLHSAGSFHPSGHAYRDSQQSLPVVTQPKQLAWGVLSPHFLMECAQQWHWMLLSCAIWTVSAFFLWCFLPTVTTKQDVSQILKEKGQRVKFGFCKRRGEKKKMIVPECAWLGRAPSGQWGKAACLVLWTNLARSAILIAWTKQALAAPLDSVLFPFALPAASLGTTCPPNCRHGQATGGNLPCPGNHTSKHLQSWQGFIPADLIHSPISAGHASEGGVSFPSVTAGNHSF